MALLGKSQGPERDDCSEYNVFHSRILHVEPLSAGKMSRSSWVGQRQHHGRAEGLAADFLFMAFSANG
jgi:hypothetical protein